MTDDALLSRSSAAGRRTLATVTLGSGIAILDGSVVNIALRRLGADLDASLTQLQWVVNGYLLALASLILVGGALGDRLGRRRTFLVGVAAFGVASALCAVAPTVTVLVLARVAQGVAAALLTPGSLAIIQTSFRREDRGPAIGTWAGLSGIAAAAGPFVGGALVEQAGWRWIFAINLPLCVAVLLLGRGVPESRDELATGAFDVPGAVTGVLLLGTSTYLLTSWRDLGAMTTMLLGVVTAVALVAFVALERRPGALVPLAVFRSRVFSAANLMTFLVYGALGAVSFFLVLQLQVTAGYDALEAGLASLPVTIALLLLSRRFAALSVRTGPRLPMTVGPLVCALGIVLIADLGRQVDYWTDVLPGMVLFALGLAGLVSPLTTAVLAAVPSRHAGMGSGVNNAVARAGSLLAVAALPAAVGLVGGQYDDPVALTAGYHHAMLTCAAMLAAGGLVSWVGVGPARFPD